MIFSPLKIPFARQDLKETKPGMGKTVPYAMPRHGRLQTWRFQEFVPTFAISNQISFMGILKRSTDVS